MATRSEIKNALLKGMGIRPTSFLLRWSPSLKKPFNFDLLEVSRCRTDGGIVTPTMPQSLRHLHSGHYINSPACYSLFDFLKVQIRWVR
jgi:hypothetical protein